MSRSRVVRLLLLSSLLLVVSTGCSRDPNVRKQKFFDSGEKYFAKGKYREAAIQYANATQIDSRFAEAHYKLSQAYLKLGDSNRAFQELSRTVELSPENYRATSNRTIPKPTRLGPIITLPRTISRQLYRKYNRPSPSIPVVQSLIFCWLCCSFARI